MATLASFRVWTVAQESRETTCKTSYLRSTPTYPYNPSPIAQDLMAILKYQKLLFERSKYRAARAAAET